MYKKLIKLLEITYFHFRNSVAVTKHRKFLLKCVKWIKKLKMTQSYESKLYKPSHDETNPLELESEVDTSMCERVRLLCACDWHRVCICVRMSMPGKASFNPNSTGDTAGQHGARETIKAVPGLLSSSQLLASPLQLQQFIRQRDVWSRFSPDPSKSHTKE